MQNLSANHHEPYILHKNYLSSLLVYKASYRLVLNILKRVSGEIANDFISNDRVYISSFIFSGVHPFEKRRMLLLVNIDSYDVLQTAQEVDKICNYFLHPRKFSYFQFKRIYKNNTSIILANHPEFFKEFLENGFIEPAVHVAVHARQSSICFWDETLSKTRLSSLRKKQKIYHGFTILSRRKDFYDCTTFAMSEFHPSPFAYYFHILKDLQKFAELFPIKAHHLIKKIPKKPFNTLAPSQGINRKHFFLPKRSARFYLGKDVNNYVTTYEALCVQLAQEGKSYKEIGSILSMASSTVKTHLTRLKARTGLTLQELSLQAFQNPDNNIFNVEQAEKPPDLISKKLKKQK